VHLFSLLFSLVLQVVYEHTLEGVLAELTHFLAHDSRDGVELPGGQDSSAVALTARQALLVHLRSVALEASGFRLNSLFATFIDIRDHQVAADSELADFDLSHLAAHVGNSDFDSITAGVLEFFGGLATHGVSLDVGVDHLLLRVHLVGVAREVAFLVQIVDICGHVDLLGNDFVATTSHFVKVWSGRLNLTSISVKVLMVKLLKIRDGLLKGASGANGLR